MKTLIILALALSGCSALEHRQNELLLPPNTICEFPNQLLVCDSSDLTDCDGYLKDKPIIIEEIEL